MRKEFAMKNYVYKVEGIDSLPKPKMIKEYMELAGRLAMRENIAVQMKQHGLTVKDVALILATIVTNTPKAVKMGYIVRFPNLMNIFSRKTLLDVKLDKECKKE